jgi:hypothetical protein
MGTRLTITVSTVALVCLTLCSLCCRGARSVARRPQPARTLRPTYTNTPTLRPAPRSANTPALTVGPPLVEAPIPTVLPSWSQARLTTETPGLSPPGQPVSTARAGHRFTGQIIKWFPNCGEVGISRESLILDANTSRPLNGVRIKIWAESGWEALSSPSGGGYGAGHYDIANLCLSPCQRTYYLKADNWNGVPLDSEVITLQFNTDDCRPRGNGHQVAVVNWYSHW